MRRLAEVGTLRELIAAVTVATAQKYTNLLIIAAIAQIISRREIDNREVTVPRVTTVEVLKECTSGSLKCGPHPATHRPLSGPTRLSLTLTFNVSYTQHYYRFALSSSSSHLSSVPSSCSASASISSVHSDSSE